MKVYLDDKNDVYTELKEYLPIVKELSEANVLLTYETRRTVGQVFRSKRGSNGIIINLQHGRQAISGKLYPEIPSLVWGEKDKEILIQRKDNPETIHIVGCPFFARLKPREKHKGINVIYTPFSRGNFQVDYRMRNELRKLNVKVITKLIKTHDMKNFDNPIITDEDTPVHLEVCGSVLAIADLVVAPHEQTFGLMAQYLDIPVVCLFERELRIPPEINIGKSSGGCAFSTLSDLVKTIEYQLEHPEELKKERKQAAIDFGGVDIENPIKEIIKTIEYEFGRKNQK